MKRVTAVQITLSLRLNERRNWCSTRLSRSSPISGILVLMFVLLRTATIAIALFLPFSWPTIALVLEPLSWALGLQEAMVKAVKTTETHRCLIIDSPKFSGRIYSIRQNG